MWLLVTLLALVLLLAHFLPLFVPHLAVWLLPLVGE
jgi:hypothetical protein